MKPRNTIIRSSSDPEGQYFDGRAWYDLSSIDCFEIGKWYLYLGDECSNSWNSSGYMDFVLDNRPHKCRAALHKDEADFLDHPRVDGGYWSWEGGFENWREIVDYKGDKMDKKEALERLAVIEVGTAKLKAIIEAPDDDEVLDPRRAWIGKWGFYSTCYPECPNDGLLGRLEGVDPGHEYGDFVIGNLCHFRYFRPATPEELGVTPSIEPDWSRAPEWVRYWAVDVDGSQHWFENEPERDDDICIWYGGGKMLSNRFWSNWRDTLRKRPETTK